MQGPAPPRPASAPPAQAPTVGTAANAGKPPAPTEFPPAVRDTIGWLQGRFGDYYRANPPPMPDRFTRREFGFILWPDKPGPPPFVRHRAYENADRFHWYLQNRPPHSVYYSTAYYRRPGEMKMLDKQWLGAELIFDLDADHLEDVEKAAADAKEGRGKAMSLAEQLALVKVQFKRLLDEFLFGDLGLTDDDVWISFSGSRGYHAHVVESRMLQMGSKERREIVDYVTGKFPSKPGEDVPDLDYIIQRKAVDVEGKGKFAKVTRQEMLAPADAPGWPGRITRSLVTALRTNVLEADAKAAKAWLVGLEGVGPDGAAKFLERFDQDALDRVARGAVDQGTVIRKVVHHVLRQSTIPFAKGETDEPVTADTKRLIRLPGSLHGKSGLRAMTLRRDELDDFEPLRDAVAFSMDPVTVKARNDGAVELGGERSILKAGEATPIPEAHAVFLLAKQGGTWVKPSK